MFGFWETSGWFNVKLVIMKTLIEINMNIVEKKCLRDLAFTEIFGVLQRIWVSDLGTDTVV